MMSGYNIAQLAEETGLSAHTLRYYEKESLIQDVPRDTGGRRYYGEAHLRVIRFVYALRSTGMPIREIKRYLALYQAGESTSEDRLALLKAHRVEVKAQLGSIKSNLRIIDRKIQGYEQGKF